MRKYVAFRPIYSSLPRFVLLKLSTYHSDDVLTGQHGIDRCIKYIGQPLPVGVVTADCRTTGFCYPCDQTPVLRKSGGEFCSHKGDGYAVDNGGDDKPKKDDGRRSTLKQCLDQVDMRD